MVQYFLKWFYIIFIVDDSDFGSYNDANHGTIFFVIITIIY